MKSRRIFVEKKEQFRVEAASLLAEFNENLSLGLGSLRLINVYDLFGFSDDLLEKSRYSVFGEVVTDTVTDSLPLEGKKYIAVEYIPGQFTIAERPLVATEVSRKHEGFQSIR